MQCHVTQVPLTVTNTTRNTNNKPVQELARKSKFKTQWQNIQMMICGNIKILEWHLARPGGEVQYGTKLRMAPSVRHRCGNRPDRVNGTRHLLCPAASVILTVHSLLAQLRNVECSLTLDWEQRHWRHKINDNNQKLTLINIQAHHMMESTVHNISNVHVHINCALQFSQAASLYWSHTGPNA